MKAFSARSCLALIAAATLACNGDSLPGPTTGPGSRVVFQGSTSSSDIHLVNADGSHLQQLTTGGNNGSPFWSRDGMRIFFYRGSGASGGGALLYSMKSDGSDVQSHSAVPPGEGKEWSPDGKRRAFAADFDADYTQLDLWVEKADGTDRTRIVDLPRNGCGTFFDCPDVTSIAWSPLGDWIAYTPYETGRALSAHADLLLVSPDGTQHRTLVPGRVYGTDWSPDGLRLAFTSAATSLIPGPSNLEVIDATGENRFVVVDGSADDTNNSFPSWSADGTYLTFARGPVSDPSASEVFIVNVDGTGLRQVSGTVGGASAPDLSP